MLPDIVPAAQSRSRKTIAQWRSALQSAENVDTPRRNTLYSIYKEVLDDAHLFSEIQKRKLAIQGSTFYMLDKNNTNDDEKLTEVKRAWFNKFIRLSMDSIFWGHSLIQLNLSEDFGYTAELVNRRHVRPEHGLHVVKEADDKGVLYREDQTVWPWLVEVGETHDLGLLNKCVPHVLIKRFAQSAWSEYCEIFGMPLRVAKTNTKDTASLNRLEGALIDMATASYAILDDGESIEFVETAASKGDVFQKLMEYCNAEISKLINGAVIGEASQGGSRSKEEVGLEIGGMITNADIQFLEAIVNDHLFPKISNLGLAVEGFTFEFERAKDLDALWTMVNESLTHFDVDQEWIKETFGIPVTGVKQVSATTVNAEARKDNDFFS